LTNLSPQLATIFAVTTGAGFLMILSGLHKSMLELRRRRRSCPSCGRFIHGSACGCTSTNTN
jgi:hypothetical protein